MVKKAPRRTAERILEVTLELFNRFGEPNVSTTLISAELRISPGNLYYHYPAKDELINTLFERYERALGQLLGAAPGVRNVEDAWCFMHSDKARAVRGLLASMERSGALHIDAREVGPTATSMVVVLTYWLSFEYVRDPRRALEPESAQAALMRGAHHVLNLLMPYLKADQRQHLLTLAQAYQGAGD